MPELDGSCRNANTQRFAAAASPLLHPLHRCDPLVAMARSARMHLFALVLSGVSSRSQVDRSSLVSGLSLSVCHNTRRLPRAPGLHPHGKPTPCSPYTAAAAVTGHPPTPPSVAGGPRAVPASEQTQQVCRVPTRPARVGICVRSDIPWTMYGDRVHVGTLRTRPDGRKRVDGPS